MCIKSSSVSPCCCCSEKAHLEAPSKQISEGNGKIRGDRQRFNNKTYLTTWYRYVPLGETSAQITAVVVVTQQWSEYFIGG